MKTFLVDSMLGKLCRWLRMLGVDTLYFREASDEELIEVSRKEGRILLTRDHDLYRVALARGAEAYLVEGRNEAERLAAISKAYGIDLDMETNISRCPECNSSIKPAKKEDVKTRVPANTLKAYRKFWVCVGCGKVYWQGSHWKRIGAVLREAKRLKRRS